jgi:hypothetical protein
MPTRRIPQKSQPRSHAVSPSPIIGPRAPRVAAVTSSDAPIPSTLIPVVFSLLFFA